MEAPRCQRRFSARLRKVKRKQSPADQPETDQKAEHKHNKRKQSVEEENEEENASSVLMNLGTDGFGLQEGP